jgi:hypothetical protein
MSGEIRNGNTEKVLYYKFVALVAVATVAA